VLVKAGDASPSRGALITLETEKATMDVPSTANGCRIKELKVQRGSRVSQGDLIAMLDADSAGDAPASGADAGAQRRRGCGPAPAAVTAPRQRSPEIAGRGPGAAPNGPALRPARGAAGVPGARRTRSTTPGFARAHASPSVRKLARELGVDLGRSARAPARKGRITDDDVKAHVKRCCSAAPLQRPARRCRACRRSTSRSSARRAARPLSRIQKISGPRLHASWVNMPHVTQFDEADITEPRGDAYGSRRGD
jgi:pyruvate dehydrogenase E2 component (dihydrolipoamide acetyltransferase)